MIHQSHLVAHVGQFLPSHDHPTVLDHLARPSISLTTTLLLLFLIAIITINTRPRQRDDPPATRAPPELPPPRLGREGHGRPRVPRRRREPEQRAREVGRERRRRVAEQLGEGRVQAEEGVQQAAQGDEVGAQRGEGALGVPGGVHGGLEVREERERGAARAAAAVAVAVAAAAVGDDGGEGAGGFGVVALAALGEALVGVVAEGREGEVVAEEPEAGAGFEVGPAWGGGPEFVYVGVCGCAVSVSGCQVSRKQPASRRGWGGCTMMAYPLCRYT